MWSTADEIRKSEGARLFEQAHFFDTIQSILKPGKINSSLAA